MSPYLEAVVAKVNSFSDDLWDNLDHVPKLPADAGKSLLTHFIELSCQCQNVANINLGRHAILSLPRDWVTSKIQSVANEQLDLNVEWEYRRLLELYKQLDKDLCNAQIALGLSSRDPEIVAAAVEFRDHMKAK